MKIQIRIGRCKSVYELEIKEEQKTLTELWLNVLDPLARKTTYKKDMQGYSSLSEWGASINSRGSFMSRTEGYEGRCYLVVPILKSMAPIDSLSHILGRKVLPVETADPFQFSYQANFDTSTAAAA